MLNCSNYQVMPLPASQRINDGQWHHLAFVWSASAGDYALIWDAVKIYADTGYSVGQPMDIKLD